MAYRFEHGETIPENVKRVARGQLDSAIESLRGKSRATSDEAVHTARKGIKKTRAVLRLVRPELGELYADQNIRLRDSGRELLELRDAGALMGVLDDLRKRSHNSARRPLAIVRKMLARQKERLEEEAETRRLKPALAADLSSVGKSISYWPIQTDGFSAIEAGLEKTYRDGRKAMGRARKTARREDYHEWRKRVKDLWYEVRLLKKLWGEVMEGYMRSIEQLEDALGDDVNLAILEARLQSLAQENGTGLKARSLTRTIDKRRQELRECAL
jgi:CHAD domain-containing protein